MPEAPASNHLVRQIGLWSGVAVVVGSTIGSGIFKSPAGIAEKLPNPVYMLLVWLVGGLVVLCGALTLAEVGSAYPYSGGVYVYIREAFGRLPAFLFGWAQLAVIRPSGVGALSIVFAQYALRFSDLKDGSTEYSLATAGLALFAIAFTTIANVFGVKMGTAIQNWTTVIKTAGLLVLVVLALVLGFGLGGASHFSSASSAGSVTFAGFGLALVSVLWAYDGWADGSFVGGEMKDPRKNLPKAILFGTIGVVLVYTLSNIGYLAVFNVKEMADSKIIAADAMTKLVGSWGSAFIVFTVMVSTFGTLNGSMLTSPRVFFALAEDRLFFKPFGLVHPRFQTPYFSIILCGVLGAIYVCVATLLTGSKAFGALSDAFVIGIVPFYALSVGSIYVFRRRLLAAPSSAELEDSLVETVETVDTKYSPSVMTPAYPATPMVFVLATVLLLANAVIDESSRIPTLITLGLVALGIPIYRFGFRSVVTN